ncbi:MAG: hypothetical protein CBARDMAM_1278 [uncultured Caballeronia sp.]|nr:MAG: hypothetical protein CBARDMAM_1278 [uncultured Caballeronia sp.]
MWRQSAYPSRQIQRANRKTGQLATIKKKASFSLEAVSDSTGRGGFVVSLMHDRPKKA